MYYDKLKKHPAMNQTPPGGHRHFALAKVGKETYIGWNNYKTRPQISYLKEDGYIVRMYHAETHVLYKIPKNKRKKAKIYVTRMSKRGCLTYSKPCNGCLFTLIEQGVKIQNIWYTDYSGNWVQMKPEDLGEINAK